MTRSLPEAAEDARSERFVAYLLDFLLMSGVAFGLWLASSVLRGILRIGTVGTMPSNPEAFDTGYLATVFGVAMLVNVLLWIAIGVVLVLYFAYFAHENDGTLGKQNQGLRVVDASGEPASKGKHYYRTALLLLPFPLMVLLGAIPFLGFVLNLIIMFLWLLVETLVMLFGSGARRLGDRAAGTYVVPEEAIETTAATDAGATGDAGSTTGDGTDDAGPTPPV